MTGSGIPAAGSRPGTASVLLHESPTTRVTCSAGVVRKEYLGTGAQERLEHESAILQRLAGVPGICNIARVPQAPRVLALQEGGTPLAHVLRAGPMLVRDMLAIAAALARTLAAVHRCGIVHRDVNPSNILIGPDGRVVLLDFESALAPGASGQPAAPEPEGRIVGTLAYLAPEQTGRTGRVVDHRADLYAFGATLFEMATGRSPFAGGDALQLIHDHLVREPEAPSAVEASLPRALDGVVLRLLAKAPEQRYQSAEGVLHDLHRLQGELAGDRDGGFPLGERDFPARLAAPQRLIGRDGEIAALHAALAAAMSGPPVVVLLEGAAGVGKSALAGELHPAVAQARGWFVQGKFDQYQREATTSGAVTQAVRALGRLLLALPRDELAVQRRAILERLGRGAGLMSRVSPEFALLLGAPPEVPDPDPRQAELRLHQATADLLGAIASPQRPVVIVLDDLQWAAAMSMRALERLMQEESLRGVLIVGAYRRAELAANEVLRDILARWEALPRPPLRIELENLGPVEVGELVGGVLRLEAQRAGELAATVRELTGGNPFDTVEMLNALRGDGVLSLGDGGWEWDSAAIRRFVGDGDIVDLLGARIARLPAASRDLLESMSCLGSAVDYRLLAAATGRTQAELQEGLRAPLEDGLIVADAAGGPESVRFRHDRVQQAVQAGTDAALRATRQLAMARRLDGDPAFAPDAAQQYLACAGHLDDMHERHHVAGLFLALARTLAGSAVHALAERYLAAATQLLERGGQGEATALQQAIDAARHAALYSLGRFADSDPLYATMQLRTAEPLALVEPTCLQMRSLDMRGQTRAAMELGLHLLAQLGPAVPEHHDLAAIESRLAGLRTWVAQDGQVDHRRREQMRDPRALATAKLLGRIVRSAFFQRDLKPIAWLLLESQQLWQRHGPCPELVASLGRIAGMLVTLRGDYRLAYDVARHVMVVGEALGYEPQASEARWVFATYTCHWFEPLENVLQQARLSFGGVHAEGDLSYAGYVHLVVEATMLETASLEAVAAEVETGIALCRRTGNQHAAAQHACDRQLVRALRGQTQGDGFEDEQFQEERFLSEMGHWPYVELTYFARRALHALVMGDFGLLGPRGQEAMARRAGNPGFHRMVHAHFFTAMARAWEVQRNPAADAGPRLEELESCRAWLEQRAADQPHNFAHLACLVRAEQAWALGQAWEAARAFDEAVARCPARARPWHFALVLERAALFHMAHGLPHAGRELLARSHAQYGAWGASAKVAQMERDHAFLRAPAASPAAPVVAVAREGSNSMSPDTLDVLGVLRASQALSSETSLVQLTARVTEVLAALSGATSVRLLSWSEEQWWLLAPAPGEPPMPLAEAGARGLLPVNALAYAERTGEALAVDDACCDDRFARDPYFAGVPLCSLLVAPIASQGAARAMLVLENRGGRAAFNAQRLGAVMMIAGQLAVSLANVQLYESLEQRVQARTRELEETQVQLIATARRAGKAEIANNVLHNVGNVLNSVNVSTAVMRRTLEGSRLDGLARAVRLMNEHRSGLGPFLETDPRGRAMLDYLNEVVEALGAERKNALDDLDRVSRSVDHIIYVVSTQQSHAGPSSVLEKVLPQDLLEEAVRVNDANIARCGAAVVRRYADLPPITLDQQRLLQILVNLIGNATQAMEGVPASARRLTLETGIAGEAPAERLRITVRDEGEGIARENLERLFAHGFTTRPKGHGFGLHSSAVAAMEMGGRLTAHSDGPGHGAAFTLEVPM